MSDIFSELHAFGYFCWHYTFSSLVGFTIKCVTWLNYSKYQNVGLSLFVEKLYFSLTECLLAPPRWPRFSAYLCWSSSYFTGSSGRWGWCNSNPVNLLCHSSRALFVHDGNYINVTWPVISRPFHTRIRSLKGRD